MHSKPLIAHVVYRFDVGGLENGIVNLINNMPADQYRHAIISLTESSDFKQRIQNKDVQIIDLNKRPGHDIKYHWRLWKLFRELKPGIVHTRNIGPMETVVTAWLAGVAVRIHGEHGWDMSDINGSNDKYRLFRRLLSPLIHRYIAMSTDIENYLIKKVGIAPDKVSQLYNGVDTISFCPSSDDGDHSVLPAGFFPEDGIIIGTVGRMSEVKNPLYLASAFAELIKAEPGLGKRIRLIMVGGGELHQQVVEYLEKAGVLDKAWLPDSRDDVSALMRAMDIFVLPSHNEGISNTILEAMATGLPVVATNVGGNPELVVGKETGFLISATSQNELIRALETYIRDKNLRTAHGNAGRNRVEQHFSLARMVERYLQIYDATLV